MEYVLITAGMEVVHRVDIAVWAVQLQEVEMAEQIRVVLQEIRPAVRAAMVETEEIPLVEARPMVNRLHHHRRLVTTTIPALRRRL